MDEVGRRKGERFRERAVGLLVALALSLVIPTGARAAPDRAQAEVDRTRRGVLIVDHGEPPEYNELTYWSFRRFFNHLIEMGLIPRWLKAIDSGTVLQDESCYGCEEPRDDPELIDAWLRPQEGPAAFVPGSSSLPAHYVKPGGPGLGEPDIFEHIGLAAWNEWELMGGRSPNYDQKVPKKRAVIEWLREVYGAALPVRVGYGIDPRIGGGRHSIRQAVLRLVNRDRVDQIVVAYHGVGFSDIMQTHMIRHEIHDILEASGAKVDLVYAEPIGTSAAYLRAVVAKVRAELGALPASASVAIHLSGHGLPTTRCGDYDCAGDAYHAFSKKLFERTKAALDDAIDRPGLGVFHIYGDGATGDDDPEDKVDGPLEALDERTEKGFEFVIDIPYEFDSDSRDTLIVLRRGYRRAIPDWDRDFTSRFRYKGMSVKITDASFGTQLKIEAFQEVIREALDLARR